MCIETHLVCFTDNATDNSAHAQTGHFFHGLDKKLAVQKVKSTIIIG